METSINMQINEWQKSKAMHAILERATSNVSALSIKPNIHTNIHIYKYMPPLQVLEQLAHIVNRHSNALPVYLS